MGLTLRMLAVRESAGSVQHPRMPHQDEMTALCWRPGHIVPVSMQRCSWTLLQA